MRGGPSHNPLHNILPAAAEDMNNNIGDESDDDVEIWSPNPWSFPRTKPGFQTIESKLESTIPKQQQWGEVILIHALGVFPD